MIADAVMTLAISLQVQFDEKMDEEEKVLKVFSWLNELEQPCLLVIDNANDVDDFSRWYPHLRRNWHFHILVTTRISSFDRPRFYP
jgi:hypothetical protein